VGHRYKKLDLDNRFIQVRLSCFYFREKNNITNAQADAGVPAGEQNIFEAVTVSRTEDATNAFDYSPRRYYPDAATSVSFSTYSPVSKNIGAGFKNNPDNKIAYTVPAPVPSGETIG
jgi:hypothetical protein